MRMPICEVALPPKCEAPRQPGKAGRGTTNYFNICDTGHSTTTARVQRLTSLCGVVGRRAELIASLIWGEATNG